MTKPAIPNSGRTVDALRESMQIADRARGNVLDSFVRVADLVDSGAVRVDQLGRLQLPAPAFTPPDFLNSWVNFDTGFSPAGYYKDAFNRIHLRGLIKNGTVGSPAFNLPAGFRPEATILYGTISNSLIGRVDVTPNGDVTPIAPSNNAWVSLEGLSFVAHH
jgi:hypothetical protein